MIAFFARLSYDSRGFASRVSADDRSFRESASASASRQGDDITTSQRLIANFSLFLSDTVAQSYNKNNKLHLSADSVT